MTESLTLSAAKALLPALYADLKTWSVSLGRLVRRHARQKAVREFASPREVIAAIGDGTISSGDWLALKCKPSPFGPFLGSHYIAPFIGSSSNLRLGPPIAHHTVPLLGMMAHMMAHLTPVGLYPPLGNGISQTCLYPPDASACGFTGLVPTLMPSVDCVQALLANRHTNHFGRAVRLTGQLQRIDVDAFVAGGFTPEQYEILRQQNGGWFILMPR